MLDVAGDTRLVEALRRGDEGVFMELVDRYQASAQGGPDLSRVASDG